MTECDYEED
jgi:hypothetical protein